MNTKLIEQYIEAILKEIGEDVKRDGLLETPKRVAKAYTELFEGYRISNSEILNKKFETTYDNGIVNIKDIPVYSFCEHHILPFFGHALITYQPKNGKVIGLSKINRLVRNCARKLQTQEQLTQDIGDALMKALNCVYVKVELKCRHMCMEMRGVNQFGSETVTQRIWGELS